MSVGKVQAQYLLLPFTALLVQKFYSRYNPTHCLDIQGNGFHFWHKLRTQSNIIQHKITIQLINEKHK